VWPGFHTRHREEVYLANWLPEELDGDHDAALERLLQRLEPVALAAQSLGQPAIHLALELEPGPLYVLGGLSSLRRLCRRLDRTDRLARTLSPVVGLNLDIPHWAFLAGIDSQDIVADKTIYRRIIHGHISDHSSGHFGDGVLGAIHDLEAFEPWFRLLAQRHTDPPQTGYPAFSGFLCNEIEAAKDSEMVQEAVKRAWRLLRPGATSAPPPLAYTPRRTHSTAP
jgi:hypothetical protein